MRFNVNDNVWVRLTELGRDHLDALHPHEARFMKKHNGWAQFQLWVVMQCFGERTFCGGKLMFETEIWFGDEPPDDGQRVAKVR